MLTNITKNKNQIPVNQNLNSPFSGQNPNLFSSRTVMPSSGTITHANAQTSNQLNQRQSHHDNQNDNNDTSNKRLNSNPNVNKTPSSTYFIRQQQKNMMNFDSFNPQKKNVPIVNSNPNEGFQVAGEKQQLRKQRNYQNKQYRQSVGREIESDLPTRQRIFRIFWKYRNTSHNGRSKK